jgi:hypothetical protein
MSRAFTPFFKKAYAFSHNYLFTAHTGAFPVIRGTAKSGSRLIGFTRFPQFRPLDHSWNDCVKNIALGTFLHRAGLPPRGKVDPLPSLALVKLQFQRVPRAERWLNAE